LQVPETVVELRQVLVVVLLPTSAVESVKTCYFLQPIFEGEPLPPAALGFPNRPIFDALPEMIFVDAAIQSPLGQNKSGPTVVSITVSRYVSPLRRIGAQTESRRQRDNYTDKTNVSTQIYEDRNNS
jgi:hypothetical protein